MITRSDELKNQKRAKNALEMIKFLCNIFSCNIPSVSHAIWVAAILRCISVWVPIVFYVPYCKAIFFCSITYCMLHWCKIPLTQRHISYATWHAHRKATYRMRYSLFLYFWNSISKDIEYIFNKFCAIFWKISRSISKNIENTSGNFW